MKRRDFIETVTAGIIAAGTGVNLSARQGRPQVMLFGMTLLQKPTAQGPIRAVMPPMSKHAAFMSGSDATIKALANGNKISDGPASNIHEGHSDLGLPGSKLVCLKPDAMRCAQQCQRRLLSTRHRSLFHGHGVTGSPD